MCSIWFHCVFSDIERKLQSKPRVMMVGLFNQSCFWYVPLFCVVCRLDLLWHVWNDKKYWLCEKHLFPVQSYKQVSLLFIFLWHIKHCKLNIYPPFNHPTFIIRWAKVAFTQNERRTNRQFSIYNQSTCNAKMFWHFSSFLTKLRSTDVIGDRKDHWFVIDFSFSYIY